MSELSVEAIQKELELRETEDLVEIWKEHDQSKWTEAAFQAIQNILTSRLGETPKYEDMAASKKCIEEAESFLEKEELYKALDKCNAAIELAPSHGYAYFVKGEVFEDLEKPEEAIKLYEQALKLSPDLKEAKKYLGWAMEELEEKNRITIRTDERILAALAHGGIVGGPVGILIPAIVWITHHEKSAYIAFQSLQAFLYQIFVALISLILGFLTIFQAFLRAYNVVAFQPALRPISTILVILEFIYLGAWIAGVIGITTTFKGRPFDYPGIDKIALKISLS